MHLIRNSIVLALYSVSLLQISWAQEAPAVGGPAVGGGDGLAVAPSLANSPKLTPLPSAILNRVGRANYVRSNVSILADSPRGLAIGKLVRRRDFVSLSVQNVTLSAFVQKAMAQRYKYMAPLRVEVRSNSALRISCSFENTNLLEVLSSISRLANCHLFLMEDSLLIAPVSALTKEEKQIAVDYADLYSLAIGNGIRTVSDLEAFTPPEQLAKLIKSQQMAAVEEKLMNSELQGKTDQPFPSVSPEMQQTLQEFVNLIGGGTILNEGSLVTIIQGPGAGKTIRISTPNFGGIDMKVPPETSLQKS
jgi:hypothetical protein